MTRPFAPRDALRLRDQQAAGTALDLEAAVLLGHSPLRRAISGIWPLGGDGVETFVLDKAESSSTAGFIQAWRRLDGMEADLAFIAPSLATANGAALCWQRLIAGACQWLGSEGVQRIFVAVEETDRVALQVFMQLGFIVYTSDMVFRLEPGQSALPMDGTLQLVPVGPAHKHEIECIERRMLPQGVSAREGAVCGDWASYPLGGRTPGASLCRAWVDDRGKVLGGWRLVAGRSGHWLRVVADTTTDAGLAVRSALTEASARPRFTRLPFFAAARGYEPSLNLALREAGFQPVQGRFRLVKHTTARILEPAWRDKKVREGGLDPAPTRTASLQQTAGCRPGPSTSRS